MLCYRSVVVGSAVEWVEAEQQQEEEELRSVDSDELELSLHKMNRTQVLCEHFTHVPQIPSWCRMVPRLSRAGVSFLGGATVLRFYKREIQESHKRVITDTVRSHNALQSRKSFELRTRTLFCGILLTLMALDAGGGGVSGLCAISSSGARSVFSANMLSKSICSHRHREFDSVHKYTLWDSFAVRFAYQRVISHASFRRDPELCLHLTSMQTKISIWTPF